MLIVLGEEHKEHLSFLNDVDADGKLVHSFGDLISTWRIVVVREFCKIAVEFLRKGVNPKLYHSATRKAYSRLIQDRYEPLACLLI